jgi:hypothetical protein
MNRAGYEIWSDLVRPNVEPARGSAVPATVPETAPAPAR